MTGGQNRPHSKCRMRTFPTQGDPNQGAPGADMDRVTAVRWFGSSLVAGAIVALVACGAVAGDSSAITAPFTLPWLAQARIAGAELHSKMTADEIAKNLANLAEQNVSVVEADSDLSRFLTDQEFA